MRDSLVYQKQLLSYYNIGDVSDDGLSAVPHNNDNIM